MAGKIWVHSARPEYAFDEHPDGSQYYIPARALPLVDEGDMIILPKTPEVEAFALFCCETLGVRSEQILFTSDTNFVMDDDVRAELLPQLAITCLRGSWTLVPYSVTERFEAWARLVPAAVWGDSGTFVTDWGHKGILHPVSLGSSHIWWREGERWTARGYFARSRGELFAARDLLGDDRPLILKPVLGSTGEGILTVRAGLLEEYSFPLGPVVLEEKLPLDTCDGEEISLSVQFNDGSGMFGAPTDQLVENFTWQGNATPSLCGEAFLREAMCAAKALLQWLRERGLKGPGGFDFLSVRGRPVLVDVNAGRFTGAHSPKFFAARFLWVGSVQSWKIHPPLQYSVDALWSDLRKAGIAFDPLRPGSCGVFPLCYLPGIWGMLVALAGSREEAEELYRRTREII